MNSAPQTTTVKGTAGTSYDVTLRFRGVVEQKSYSNVTAGGPVATGTNATFFSIGGTPGGDGWNVYKLSIQPPGAGVPSLTANLNTGASGMTVCWPLDYSVTLPMEAGSTITLTTDTVDGRERTNQDTSGTPIVIPGIAPSPDPYNGQFVQMDVTGVVAQP